MRDDITHRANVPDYGLAVRFIPVRALTEAERRRLMQDEELRMALWLADQKVSVRVNPRRR